MTNYQRRFLKVINYIEAHLDTDLDVNALCQHAYLSKYHFHRQCSAFFGMSVIKLVRLLRLKRAAYQLYRDNGSILDIALANGYESHEAFSRAFKSILTKPIRFSGHTELAPWHAQYDPY